MVELAAGAMASLFSGATAAAGAAGTAVAGVGSALAPAAGAGSLFAGILQGGAGVTSAYAATRAAGEQSAALENQAFQTQVQAQGVGVSGDLQANSLKKGLLDTLGQRDVAYAASGVDLSFGTPQIARTQAVTDAGNAPPAQPGRYGHETGGSERARGRPATAGGRNCAGRRFDGRGPAHGDWRENSGARLDHAERTRLQRHDHAL